MTSTDLAGAAALVTGATSGIGRAAARSLARRGAHVLVSGRDAAGRGSVINVLTMVAHFGVAGMALYGSSKAALTLLTKAWAAEFGPSGVRVNAVSPGPTRTEGTEVMGDQLDQLAALAPAGRPAAPEEIASAIAYLASDEASFVHGAVLDVDGGRHAA